MHHNEDQWERNFRRFEAMARRGFGRLAGNFRLGDFDGFGENFRIGRMLASGDLRLVALYLIDQQPRHGYDLIKAIEERSGGFYAPSPGVVYPALTFLEEAGYVTSSADGNKKLYTITEEGRAHLSDNRQGIEGTLQFLERAGNRMRDWRDKMASGTWTFEHSEGDGDTHEHRHGHEHGRQHQHRHHHHGPAPDRDMRDVVPEMNDARRDLKAAITDAMVLGADEQRRVAQILRDAAASIRDGAAEDDVDL